MRGETGPGQQIGTAREREVQGRAADRQHASVAGPARRRAPTRSGHRRPVERVKAPKSLLGLPAVQAAILAVVAVLGALLVGEAFDFDLAIGRAVLAAMLGFATGLAIRLLFTPESRGGSDSLVPLVYYLLLVFAATLVIVMVTEALAEFGVLLWLFLSAFGLALVLAAIALAGVSTPHED